MKRTPLLIGCILSVAFAGGCSLAPAQTHSEQQRADLLGNNYEKPFEMRQLPPLPAKPGWPDVLQRAFLANGDLEADYFDWQAALKRVQETGAYPNANLALGYEYMFSREKMKSWDRNTLSLGFDPSMNLTQPIKVIQAARISLDEAKAAGKRFEAAKFALQQKVLTSWYELALVSEKIRIQTQNVSLLKMVSEIAAQRVRSGGAQQDLLKAQTEYELSINDLANLKAERSSIQATLNGMLALPPQVDLEAPDELPISRPLNADDQTLISHAVDNNPELAALAHNSDGRRGGVDLAKLGYLPDVSLSIGIQGSIEQNIGTMIAWPANLARVAAGVEQARAMLRQSEATARQARSDRWAQFAATLYLLRNNERQAEVFGRRIMPAAQQAWETSAKAYSAGLIGFSDLIDSQRLLLQVRLLVAEARMGREKNLAQLEALAGLDVETLNMKETSPATVGTGSAIWSSTLRPGRLPTAEATSKRARN